MIFIRLSGSKRKKPRPFLPIEAFNFPLLALLQWTDLLRKKKNEMVKLSSNNFIPKLFLLKLASTLHIRKTC